MSKAKAWNSALDFARGEYVLFLDGDDCIFPNAVHLLCQICAARDADVICGLHYLEENPAGDVNIGGIADKKFSRRVDEQINTLNESPTLREKDLYQRLMIIGKKIFNPLPGTKFFRRDFLTKNFIRFNENLTDGFELLFLVNAIMASNEIFFTPNLFYIAPRRRVSV